MSSTLVAARAALALGRNIDGEVVKPARGLYPHQWSWDTAFISIGLSHVDPALARANLDALFQGQWHNGMVPHIVFDPDVQDYFPDADRWACSEVCPDAPSTPRTSGICQPPLHAIAVQALVDGGGGGPALREGTPSIEATMSWAAGTYPKLLAWHRFLARERVDGRTGLVRIFHGWESGMDNSPRWDAAYSRVEVGPTLPPYRRRDLHYVADPGERPEDREYDRYLWLVEEYKEAGYNQATLSRVCSFNVGDVFFTAIFAAANDHLANLAQRLSAPEEAEIRGYADQARQAVHRRMEQGGGVALDLDLRTNEDLARGTIAEFSPLIAGGLPAEQRAALVAALTGPDWAGNPGLRWPLPPSTSPSSAYYRPRTYWRGPVWPVMTWLLAWSLRREGETEIADQLRATTLAQLEDGAFAEYYEPFTGEALGAAAHSWTAAVALDWLCSRRGSTGGVPGPN